MDPVSTKSDVQRGDGQRAALVTGAGDRIGRAIAVDLAARGWAVAVHYNTRQAAAATTVAAIERAGGRAAAVAADLSVEAAIQDLVPSAVAGPLDLLVNNAAHFAPDTAESATRASWDAHIETNLRAPIALSQGFAARLPAGAGGVVVNILDQWVARPSAGFLSYTIAKSALHDATRMLALALAPRARVNAIAPGPVLRGRRQSEGHFAGMLAETLLGRATDPVELCEAVAFIVASPALTGQCLLLDNGYALGGYALGGYGHAIARPAAAGEPD